MALDGCPILQTESADPAMGAMEAKLHRVKNGKLCADAHPRHGDGKLPLVGKVAGQLLLVRCIITMKDSLCGTHKWCKEARSSSAAERYLAFLADAAQLAMAAQDWLAWT